MPELPEVETVVRSLAPHATGRTILEARYLAPRAALGQPDAMAAHLTGRRIQALRRTGKHILFQLDHGLIDVHLRMTGKLLWNAHPGPYTRALLTFDRGHLVFDDVRQFGYLVWLPSAPPLGPDMLSVPPQHFSQLLHHSRARIKPLLLDQSKLAGLGNIYVDEALHRAGIHPLALAARLSAPRRAALHHHILQVLHESLDAGGSSISDYVDSEGRAGAFQSSHRVYGRQSEPCPACATPIRRIVVAQRGTHFCPHCQKR